MSNDLDTFIAACSDSFGYAYDNNIIELVSPTHHGALHRAAKPAGARYRSWFQCNHVRCLWTDEHKVY